jgi:hypothetical protein
MKTAEGRAGVVSTVEAETRGHGLNCGITELAANAVDGNDELCDRFVLSSSGLTLRYGCKSVLLSTKKWCPISLVARW